MRSDITPGKTSDYRGFDSDKVRKMMEARNVVPVIPMRKSRRLRVVVDRALYRLRNLLRRMPPPPHSFVLHLGQKPTSERTTFQGADQQAYVNALS